VPFHIRLTALSLPEFRHLITRLIGHLDHDPHQVLHWSPARQTPRPQTPSSVADHQGGRFGEARSAAHPCPRSRSARRTMSNSSRSMCCRQVTEPRSRRAPGLVALMVPRLLDGVPNEDAARAGVGGLALWWLPSRWRWVGKIGAPPGAGLVSGPYCIGTLGVDSTAVGRLLELAGACSLGKGCVRRGINCLPRPRSPPARPSAAEVRPEATPTCKNGACRG
jgi:hypothetical protein